MANDFENLFASRRNPRVEERTEVAAKSQTPGILPPGPKEALEPQNEPEAVPKKKRGRPATGKRSDAGWIGRTYYIQEKTDIEIEIELATMRRQGVSLDKSELVDALLSAWIAWRKGEDANSCFGEFSPRQKDE